MRVDATSYEDVMARVAGWAEGGESRYVCVASVNNVMQALEDEDYMRLMNAADLVTPDGMPLVWGLRMLGVPDATRVYGPDLTPALCRVAAERGIAVGFYGGTPQVLDRLCRRLSEAIPDLRIPFSESPPFRELEPHEADQVADRINASGVRILFVGLGCPKQERWMAAHKGRVDAVLLGVGAAFDFISGAKRRAPGWMQRIGLEWLFRLVTEPRRLWKRYSRQNPHFVLRFAWQLIRHRGRAGGRG